MGKIIALTGTGASQIELLSYKTLAVCVRMF